MKDIIDFDKVNALYDELMLIEKYDLQNCTFIKDGKEVQIPEDVIYKFLHSGLMNRDFVLSSYLPSKGVKI